MSARTYSFVRPARRAASLLVTAGWLMACTSLYVVFDAHGLICAGLALFALPSLYEIGRASQARLDIDHKEIRWQSGSREGRLPRGVLEKVRLDTRLDFSLRMTLVSHQGSKTRLPYECVPPASEITAALEAQGIAFERHHFALMG